MQKKVYLCTRFREFIGMYSAFFFDMDGVLIDSMPNHVRAWVDTLSAYGIAFTPRDCYINEGRTGRDVIQRFSALSHIPMNEELLLRIYNQKTALYRQIGGAAAMPDMERVLMFLKEHNIARWVVTGSGLNDLYEQLQGFYPNCFCREQMITASDVKHGKPSPEPYLKAWERTGLDKSQCCVIENAPLGIQAGKAAGLFTIGVNTGVLQREDLTAAGADLVLDNMAQLYDWLQA